MCSPRAWAQASGAGSRKAKLMPSGVPARASMRPSWPPPITPIFMRYISPVAACCIGRMRPAGFAGVGVVEHGPGLLGAVLLERRVVLRMLVAEDAGGEQRGIDRTGLADGQGGDRDAGGHLDDG